MKLNTARMIMAKAATFINANSKIELSLVAKKPKRKKRGTVHKVKEKRTAAEEKGLPVPKAKAIMAWVVPQGIKIVKAPTKPGAKMSFFLV